MRHHQHAREPEPLEEPFIGGVIDSQAFAAYWDAVDAEMLKRYSVNTADCGIEPEEIAEAQENGQTPEQFAIRFGEHYDLIDVRKEWGPYYDP